MFGMIKANGEHGEGLNTLGIMNRVPMSSENHGKPGKSHKKVPCMEKS